MTWRSRRRVPMQDRWRRKRGAGRLQPVPVRLEPSDCRVGLRCSWQRSGRLCSNVLGRQDRITREDTKSLAALRGELQYTCSNRVANSKFSRKTLRFATATTHCSGKSGTELSWIKINVGKSNDDWGTTRMDQKKRTPTTSRAIEGRLNRLKREDSRDGLPPAARMRYSAASGHRICSKRSPKAPSGENDNCAD